MGHRPMGQNGSMVKIDKNSNIAHRPLILAVETSSRIGSAALGRGRDLLEETAFSAPLRHSAEVFPTLQALLSRHGHTPDDVDQIHIAIGPGSFTGLRIAVTLAKTMHLATGVRIVTVDALDVVVANLGHPQNGRIEQKSTPDRIAALFDAKRGQFFVAVYERTDAGRNEPGDPGYEIPAPGNAAWRKILPDRLMTPGEIVDQFATAGPLGVLGDGLLFHRDRFPAERVVILPESCWSPRAANVHWLGTQKAARDLSADPLALTPFYLRGPQVTLRQRP